MKVLRVVYEIPRSGGSSSCPVGWMEDLYELAMEADKVITF